jgi:hypothetical protein
MGLSPGKGKKKVNAQEAKATQAIAAVAAPDPLEQKIREKQQRVIDWDAYQGGDKNILNAPGIGDYMDIYGSANQAAEAEQMGGGAIRLADPSSNAYAAQVKELGKNQRYDARAQGISDAWGMLKGDAYGQANNLIDRELQKKLGVAGLEQRQLGLLYNRYKKQNPWYQKLWNAGLQAGTVGGRLAMGG